MIATDGKPTIVTGRIPLDPPDAQPPQVVDWTAQCISPEREAKLARLRRASQESLEKIG